MNIIEDEVIGELRYLTVEFEQKELVTGGMGVISQDAVKRYFVEKRPDLKVKKCGGLKLDSQRGIVTMRIGVVNNQPEKLLNPMYGGTLKSIAEETVAANNIPGHEEQKFIESVLDMNKAVGNFDRVPGEQKLLSPGYDELKEDYDGIAVQYTELLEKCNAGMLLRNKLIDDLVESEKQLLALQKLNEELRADPYTECPHCVEIAVLQGKYDALVAAIDPERDDKNENTQEPSDLLVKNEELRAALQSAQAYYENDEYSNMSEVFKQTLKEDSADFAEAKKAIAGRDSINLEDYKRSDFEMTGADSSKIEGEKAENAGCGERKNHIKINSQDVGFDDKITGPSSESIPTVEEVADAAVKVAESNMTGESLLAPIEEITQEEAKKRYRTLPEESKDV